ncbi:MAG: hypothetical protein JWM28_3796, partial [Chitinophagaceae bacterium]|nr:hypothetical protein [Chitinophagaceae bacterium]
KEETSFAFKTVKNRIKKTNFFLERKIFIVSLLFNDYII